jgi:hypothetical protein
MNMHYNMKHTFESMNKIIKGRKFEKKNKEKLK